MKRIGLVVAVVLSACTPRSANDGGARFAKPGAQCDANSRGLTEFVQALPERPLTSSLHVDVPTSNLGGVFGQGPVLEISDKVAIVDGRPLPGDTLEARVKGVYSWLNALQVQGALSPNTAGERPVLFVAAAPNIDIRTLRAFLVHVPPSVNVSLLVQVPQNGEGDGPSEDSTEAGRAARALLGERDPSKRVAVSNTAFETFSRCPALTRAVQSIQTTNPSERWPRVRRAVIQALPSCRCDELDTESLRRVLLAEQRAGSAALGALGVSFVRDERCGASMPLRSVSKLLEQIEAFDAEFAGEYQRDAVAFERVLTNDRLLTYFCDALPGETLAALQRKRATLYWRTSATGDCQPWQFRPLAPGSPMGTWARADGSLGSSQLAFHYRQGAEELRLFGPVSGDTTTKPTDDATWACDQTFEMKSVDEQSIQLKQGSWFFSRDACERGSSTSVLANGCVLRTARGEAATSAAEESGSETAIPAEVTDPTGH